MARKTLGITSEKLAVAMSLEQREKYVPNLKQLIHDCETNYLRMLRLLPQLSVPRANAQCSETKLPETACVSTRWAFAVEKPDSKLSRVEVSIDERAPYTTTLTLTQTSLLDRWVPQAAIKVRLYHDANLAEVLSYQANHRIKQSYDYPNKKMYQRNEKAQLNAFLGEWLQSCLKAGCAIGLCFPVRNDS